MKVQPLLITVIACYSDAASTSWRCQRREEFEAATLAWQKTENPPMLDWKTRGWVDSSVDIPLAKGTVKTYADEEYTHYTRKPGVQEFLMVEDYLSTRKERVGELLLTKQGFVWSGPHVLDKVECPSNTTCHLGARWESNEWKMSNGSDNSKPNRIVFTETDTYSQFDYSFYGPSTQSLIANSALESLEISYIEASQPKCAKGHVYTYQQIDFLDEPNYPFGTISIYIHHNSTKLTT
ncbi:hypothetical protein DSO57_1032524 [Entomophthora muscae]|uniref:Uncharacterized protein n=1 Tax=Entomophthora muscae TaxID=34485 RepID=A0ACC2SP96_9FUNG|nr:hypothetical protein DSO57_1032524 [Entomophthora muscae]